MYTTGLGYINNRELLPVIFDSFRGSLKENWRDGIKYHKLEETKE